MRVKTLVNLRVNSASSTTLLPSSSNNNGQQMEMSTFWGEETERDAIFAVYLKKVRYVPPTHRRTPPSKSQIYDDDDLEQLQWETVKDKKIKYGTLEKILKTLILSSGELNHRHYNVVFATYRVITTPDQVLRILGSQYEEYVDQMRVHDLSHDSTILLKKLDCIRSVLMWWLDGYAEDFDAPPEFSLLNSVLNFAQRHDAHLKLVFDKANVVLDRCNKFIDDVPVSIRLVDDACLTRVGVEFSSVRSRSDLYNYDAKHVANQLTLWDSQLFTCMQPHQCQAKIISRSREDKYAAYSVQASIEQFNALVNRVSTSVLHQSDMKHSARARLIIRWIHIAKELRLLRNFSSLKAVLAGLQCEPVHRLKNTWVYVCSDDMLEMESLAKTFSDDSGVDEGARRVLDLEGTGKGGDSINPLWSPRKNSTGPRLHQRSKSDVGSGTGGTVPFLGNFLTDLNRIDEMLAYTNSDGWYNVEKLRKEFDVLARLKLYQHAAKAYVSAINKDPKFPVWFKKLPCLKQTECYNKSVKIEPLQDNNNTPDLKMQQPRHFRKTSTLSNIFKTLLMDNDHLSDSDKWFGVVPEVNSARRPSTPKLIPRSNTSPQGFHSTPNSPARHGLSNSMTGHSQFYPSAGGFSTPLFSTPPNNFHAPEEGDTPPSDNSYRFRSPATIKKSHSEHMNPLNRITTQDLSKTCGPSFYKPKSHEPTCYVLKVAIEASLQHNQKNGPAGPTYKCIKLENGDTMRELINKALMKHLIDEDADQFCLIQVLEEQNRTFLLPDKCKPFYAVVTSEANSSGFPLHFVLRRKCDHKANPILTIFTRKKRRRRSNLLRWSSGFL